MRRERTGLVTEGCYAAHLRDCDGQKLSREHFISKNLLERAGSKFEVRGLAWSREPRMVTPANVFVGKVLCRKHNSDLDFLDRAVSRFYDALLAALNGEEATFVVDGAEIERWSLKALFGMVTSGNSSRIETGKSFRVYPGLPHVESLFGLRELPEGLGFYSFIPRNERRRADVFAVTPEMFPPDHPKLPDACFGIRITMLAHSWLTSLVPLAREAQGVDLYHRPEALIVGDRTRIEFRWPDGPRSPGIRFSLTEGE